MLQQLRTAAVMLLVLTSVTGVVYPLIVTGIGQLVFPHQANGSLIAVDGKPVGSELIGQQFTRPEYFWGRLSATGYNAASSSGSNYGPLASGLSDAVKGRVDALEAAGSPTTDIPVDLVTASGSGIDPHISPAAAEFQVPRVAAARNMSEDDVRELVNQFTEDRTLGVLGEPRVNVLLLNLALDGHSNE